MCIRDSCIIVFLRLVFFYLRQGIVRSPIPKNVVERVRRKLTFLSARLTVEGMLDRQPWSSTASFSLERAIRYSLIKPPSFNFLRQELDLLLFKDVLPALRLAWKQRL